MPDRLSENGGLYKSREQETMIVVNVPQDRSPQGSRIVRVGIAGLGRSGWLIHAMTINEMPGKFRVVAVADPKEERLAEAVELFGCGVHRTFESLVEDDAVDVIVVATPSHLHEEHTIRALRAGKHVIVEKPFSMSAAEARNMIATAEEVGRIIAPFQNRRFEGHFLKVRELIDAGTFGEIVQIRMAWHFFSRRWDWQAMRRYGGGALTNNGAHLIDQAMELFGEGEPEIFLDLKPGLTLGDAEQHMKLVLHGEGHPTIDIELTNACAFPQKRWLIMGTSGGLEGTTQELRWRSVDWSKMPERELDLGAASDRLYNNEDMVWNEGEWKDTATSRDPYKRFFANLHAAICSGRPLVVTPASALRCMEVLDRCREGLEALK
ncbi:MAG: Gfo/Idh/MocA family oxidoreductase [Phycisphaerales bacterium]|nr:Gfo/Idh/MocA family oxidoreductase [Phycisphaerales bacterium]MCB9837133.1 Gfo/Idh/MocA family oxidoreductase [Phycisphaera sp.]